MKLALKIISSTLSVLLVIILIISMWLMISSRITGSQPSILGNQLMLVLSGSMEPTLNTGSVIGVTPLKDKTKLQEGEIITFYSPIKENTIFTHRITEVNGSGQFTEYVTQGDNNKTEDPIPVPADMVIGKYANIHIPYAGYILNFLQSKNGIALGLIIPGLLLIVYNIFSLWRLFKNWDPSKNGSTSETHSNSA